MAFVNHKRVKEGDDKPHPLCGAKEWISLISVDTHVDCKKCLREMKKPKQE